MDNKARPDRARAVLEGNEEEQAEESRTSAEVIKKAADGDKKHAEKDATAVEKTYINLIVIIYLSVLS